MPDHAGDPDPQSSKRLGLESGRRYRVIKAFTDADGTAHHEGEEWTFLGSRFSRFEDEHILSVRPMSGYMRSFGLISREEAQDSIVRSFRDFVTEI